MERAAGQDPPLLFKAFGHESIVREDRIILCSENTS